MLRETRTENGRVRGMAGADPRVTAYRGIPFAAPPVGENRWRVPQPCGDWEGVRSALEFAPIPVQDPPGRGDDLYCREFHVDPDIPMSEDCLYLNIWTPAKSAAERMPVLVWFFGGAFQWGYTAEMEFDGERLARRGIVVVSVGYRLGALGFLAHPEITAEARRSGCAPANFGLLDQQAGLAWVSRNIAAFGGDPGNVTIAGQSAGGASVLAQMTCEENYDRIRRAVVFSGIIRHPEPARDLFRTIGLAEAEQRGEAFFCALGVRSLAQARALDAQTIRERYAAYACNHPRMVPIADGVFCKDDPMARFVRGERAPVPVLAGWTADEFFVNGVNVVERSVREAFLEAQKNGDRQPLYSYCFAADIPGWDRPGCFHSVDLWFFFETLGKCWRPFVGRHYDLARRMCDAFANFVRTGDPNGEGTDGRMLPHWRPARGRARNEMIFGTGEDNDKLTEESECDLPPTDSSRGFSDAVLREVLREIDTGFARELTLKELGKKYYINACYLGQVITERCGKPFKTLLTERRIAEAERLLRQPDARLSEIAERVGYRDSAYFVRKFTACRGCTPSQYRRSLSSKNYNSST